MKTFWSHVATDARGSRETFYREGVVSAREMLHDVRLFLENDVTLTDEQERAILESYRWDRRPRGGICLDGL